LTGELHLPLGGEDGHLPVQDAARQAVAHRDAGGAQLVILRHARRVLVHAARIHQEPNLDAALPRPDELVGVARVGHHPVAHVDLDSFLLDVGQHVGAAILERRIAEPLLGCEGLSRRRSGSNANDEEKR